MTTSGTVYRAVDIPFDEKPTSYAVKKDDNSYRIHMEMGAQPGKDAKIIELRRQHKVAHILPVRKIRTRSLQKSTFRRGYPNFRSIFAI